MSYAVAAALQSAIYTRLVTDPALTGTPVFDAMPPGAGTGTYLLLGPEDVRDASDKTGGGAEHRVTISVISDAAGFQTAKVVAGKASAALVNAGLTLTEGRLVGLTFLRAVAKRVDDGAQRRIDLTFRARTED